MAVCYVIAAVCIAALLYVAAQRKMEADTLKAAVSDPVLQQGLRNAVTSVPQGAAAQEGEIASPDAAVPTPVPVPVDFDYLQGINRDIYAWLHFGWSGKELPVVQREGDDSYYLRRDINGDYSAAGTVFSESKHNARDFNDPCTVLFGHNMTSGVMFGGLADNVAVMDLDNAEAETNYITIYTPGGIRRYRIVCSGVFSNESILYYYNFSTEYGFNSFFDMMQSCSGTAYKVSTQRPPVFGDDLLILSTCQGFSSEHRFLTVAVLTERQGV